MQDKINAILTKINFSHAQRRKLLAVLLVLSVFVSGGVFYQLRLIGISMSGEAYCGCIEHEHTADCIEKQLICTLAESDGHSHNVENGCFETNTVLTCSEQEHIHEQACFETLRSLICEQDELHTHTETCYAEGQVLICTISEHQHNENCFTEEQTLIDSEEETAHVHTDECYEETLVCGFEADYTHIHTLQCYSDPNADLETAEDWEKSVRSAVLTGDWGADLSAIAKTQLGYRESADNFMVDEDGITVRGITRYGQWYSEPYADWSAIFVSWCFNYANISSNYIPYESDCSRWVKKMTENGYYQVAASFTPDIGDVIFFDRDQDGLSDDIGIIVEIEEEASDAIILHTIEGDRENTVNKADYSAFSYEILGYCDLSAVYSKFFEASAENSETPMDPEGEQPTEGETGETPADPEEEPPTDGGSDDTPTDSNGEQPTEDETGETPADPEEEPPTDGESDDTPTDSNGEQPTEGETGETPADPGEEPPTEGDFDDSPADPEDDLSTDGDTAESAEGEQLIQKISLEAVVFTDKSYTQEGTGSVRIQVTGALPEGAKIYAYPVEVELDSVTVICAYDLTVFLEDGSVYEPIEPLTVSFIAPELAAENEDAKSNILFIPEDGEPEPVESTVTDEGITFVTDHFSTYAWVQEGSANITSSEALQSAVNGANGTAYIQLAGDITISSADRAMTIPSGADVTIDLNGHKLDVSGQGTTPLFTIPAGAALTIVDTATDQGENTGETENSLSIASASNAGMPAAAVESNGDITLTYYLTKSEITDTTTGKTAETRFQRTVTSKGLICGTFNYPLFAVNGGTLNIGSGFIYGGSASDHAIEQSGGEVNLSGGYICGFTQNNSHNENYYGGAIRTTGGALNISGTAVLAANKAPTGGAAAVLGGSLNISGGVISGNTATLDCGTSENNKDYGGGGVYAKNATVSMSAGYLTNNSATCTGYFNGGGGILLFSSNMVMSGGYITGNQAASGGGIRTAYYNGNHVYIKGGFICANYARSAEGGGVCIDNQGYCEVDTQYAGNCIYVNNNATNSSEHWGGGGLFVANGATMLIQNALITDNAAGGYGGGVAGCSTGRVVIALQNGAAIYNNIASGIHLSGNSSTKNDDNTYAALSEIFLRYGYSDYYCALASTVFGGMLGGNAANWSGSMDNEVVTNVGANDVLNSSYIMGLTAYPSSSAIAAAQSAASVYVTGNSAYTHGGGVLSNGHLVVGDITYFDIGDSLQLEANKVLRDADGGTLEVKKGDYAFEVTDSLNNVVSIGTTQDGGSIYFDRRLSFDKDGTFTYQIRETDSRDPSIIMDTAQYTLIVSVVKEQKSLYISSGESISYNFYKIAHIKLTKETNGTTETLYDNNVNSSESSAYHYDLPTPTFTNHQMNSIDITVRKQWSGSPGSSVTVRLYRNNEVFDTQILTADGNWSYTWRDLQTSDDAGNTFSYEVREVVPDGYVASYSSSNAASSDYYWVPASKLEAGEQYIIVNSDGNTVLSETAENANAQFTAADTASIIQQNGTLSLGGTDYSTWYEDRDVAPAMIFTATSNNHDGTTRLILKNAKNTVSSLLVQGGSSDTARGLKGCNSDYYASSMRFENGRLEGQFEWSASNAWYSIVYADGRFNSSNSSANAVKLYTRVSSPITQSTTVTITNTAVEDARFSLNITKQDADDSNIKLPNATFRLLDSNGNAVGFIGGSGTYSAASASTAPLTVSGYRSEGLTPWGDGALSNLFDGKYSPGTQGTNWTKTGGSTNGSVTIYFDFDSARTLTHYTLVSGNDSGAERNPNSWVLYGSVDGNTWNAIDEVVSGGMTDDYFASYDYPVETPGSYPYYKIVFSTNNGFQLCEMLLYGGDVITDLVTVANGKLIMNDLPAGTYTLHEAAAPNGYYTAEDTTVVLGNGEGTSVFLTVEDPRIEKLVLPETGGMGIVPHILGGLMAISLSAYILYIKIKRKGDGCI